MFRNLSLVSVSMTLLLCLLFLTPSAFAGAVFTYVEIEYVFGGYPDGSVAFIPQGGGRTNPANCPQTQAYTMPPDHDVRSALSVLLTAKAMNKGVYISLRDDICYAPQQTDAPVGGYPVFQRVAIR